MAGKVLINSLHRSKNTFMGYNTSLKTISLNHSTLSLKDPLEKGYCEVEVKGPLFVCVL